MLIADRIQLIIKAHNHTPSSFADEIGIKRSNLSHVLSGRNKPGIDFLSKVIEHFPNVNASWLITGETREGDFKEQSIVSTKTPAISDKEKQIDRIVIFYSDGSFETYSESSYAITPEANNSSPS